jgi:hypothetical protein
MEVEQSLYFSASIICYLVFFEVPQASGWSFFLALSLNGCRFTRLSPVCSNLHSSWEIDHFTSNSEALSENMAASLPFELLCEIAGYLEHEKASLVACTTLCRRWQAAFEPIIYSDLRIYSKDGINREGEYRGISLKQFQALTSGLGIARRAWIRQLWYRIVVPFELPDWMTRKEDGYTTNNAVRQANDAAFQSAVISLFNTLELWDRGHRLSVVLLLKGREPGQEPYTEEDDEAGLYNWNTADFGVRPVPVYRARFHDNDASMLRDVPCIDKISLPHRIWAGAAMQIARHCPKLTELCLNLEDYIRPDHLEYMKKRRQGMRLSCSLVPRGMFFQLH